MNQLFKKALGGGMDKPKLKVGKSDQDILDAVHKSRNLLDRMEQDKKKKEKSGHWETDCCGVRVWVED